MQKTSTFFMFVGDQYGKAEEAMKFYTSLFSNSSIKEITRNVNDGTVLYAKFTLNGIDYMSSDSGFAHEFTFTPAISIAVTCENEEEIDSLFASLSDGGLALMPLGSYSFSKKFAWVKDKYGVSWQLFFW